MDELLNPNIGFGDFSWSLTSPLKQLPDISLAEEMQPSSAGACLAVSPEQYCLHNKLPGNTLNQCKTRVGSQNPGQPSTLQQLCTYYDESKCTGLQMGIAVNNKPTLCYWSSPGQSSPGPSSSSSPGPIVVRKDKTQPSVAPATMGPVNCEFEENCSEQCGGEAVQRVTGYTTSVKASNGGTPCPTATGQPCSNLRPCTEPECKPFGKFKPGTVSTIPPSSAGGKALCQIESSTFLSKEEYTNKTVQGCTDSLNTASVPPVACEMDAFPPNYTLSTSVPVAAMDVNTTLLDAYANIYCPLYRKVKMQNPNSTAVPVYTPRPVPTGKPVFCSPCSGSAEVQLYDPVCQASTPTPDNTCTFTESEEQWCKNITRCLGYMVEPTNYIRYSDVTVNVDEDTEVHPLAQCTPLSLCGENEYIEEFATNTSPRVCSPLTQCGLQQKIQQQHGAYVYYF